MTINYRSKINPDGLTSIEIKIMEALLSSLKPLPPARIYEKVHGEAPRGVEAETIKWHVGHIRNKLGEESIITIRGFGYVLGDYARNICFMCHRSLSDDPLEVGDFTTIEALFRLLRRRDREESSLSSGDISDIVTRERSKDQQS